MRGCSAGREEPPDAPPQAPKSYRRAKKTRREAIPGRGQLIGKCRGRSPGTIRSKRKESARGATAPEEQFDRALRSHTKVPRRPPAPSSHPGPFGRGANVRVWRWAGSLEGAEYKAAG